MNDELNNELWNSTPGENDIATENNIKTENNVETNTGTNIETNVDHNITHDVEQITKQAITTYPVDSKEETSEPSVEVYDTYNYTSSYTESIHTEEPVAATPEQSKQKHPFLKAVKWMACAACFGVIAGAAFLGTSYLAGGALGIDFGRQNSYAATTGNTSSVDEGSASSEQNNATPLNVTINTTSPIQSVENPAESVVVQVVEENLAATVAVKSTYVTTYSYWGQQYQQEGQSSGSGFIVGINDTELLIATNNHVIEDTSKIEITFIDDSIVEATVKGTDSIADLAILAVPLKNISADTLSQIRVATLGNSDEVRLGEMAIAIGNALGYGQSVTVGYISAKDREVTVDGNAMILLQTDAAINGGNSGGPLFNTKGEVIGINSVKYASTDVEGMCFAIPISRATPILNELMNRETLADEDKGFLGISSKTVTDDIASFYGWPLGAYVSSVLEGSPAEAAKIYVGDIITGVNSVKIVTADQLVAAVSSYRYGTTVDLTIQRLINGKYEELTISATLVRRADVPAANTDTDANQESAEDNKNSDNSNDKNSNRPGINPGR